METKGNTNRVAKAATFPEDTRVILYKKPGPSPESHLGEFRNMSYIHAADEDEAKGLIDADGWFRTPAEAEAAHRKETTKAVAGKPRVETFSTEVIALLDPLRGKDKDKVRVEYAQGLGVDVRKMNEADALAAIGAALSKTA